MTVEAKISNAEMEYLESLRRWKQAKANLATAQKEHTRSRIAFNKSKKSLETAHPAARHDGKIKVSKRISDDTAAPTEATSGVSTAQETDTV